ncbi:uncharacterized protein RJT20DRAFT_30333 [Scheffersomyces xylosifermentans]|uniref:uncharacterized protein n=1 Tax=Scheffersomyces xylosifermentans TaxID=1304137 RepID=UPI00315D7ECC
MIQQLSDKLLHKSAIRSLYRNLIRHTKRLNNISNNTTSPALTYLKDSNTYTTPEATTFTNVAELNKIKLDPTLYFKNLSYELSYSFRIEFTRTDLNSNWFPQAFGHAISIDEFMGALLDDQQTNKLHKLDELLTIVVNYRHSQFIRQKWRADYLSQKDEIDKKINREKEVNNKRVSSKQPKKPTDPLKIYHKLTNIEIRKVIKNELKRSDIHLNHLLRRYFKQKQANKEIPLPHLLPYTSDEISLPASSLKKSSLVPIGTTTNSSIDAAYDKVYIQSVIIPSLEYDINKRAFLDRMDNIVNELGPTKVKIRTTSSAFNTLSYITMPYPTIPELQELGIDFKKSSFLARLQNVWESSPGNMKDENQLKDGSYSIKKSGGFGIDECIYPRYHYESLATDEALWEYLLDLEISNRSEALTRGSNKSKSKKVFSEAILEKYKREWTQALEITSEALNADIEDMKRKYQVLRGSKSPLAERKDKLQKQQFKHFDKTSVAYQELMSQLNKHQIFKHSEIVNFGDRVANTYDKKLRDHSISKKAYYGIGKTERLGMGKTLGDYLEDSGQRHFKWGYVFYDNFKF